MFDFSSVELDIPALSISHFSRVPAVWKKSVVFAMTVEMFASKFNSKLHHFVHLLSQSS